MERRKFVAATTAAMTASAATTTPVRATLLRPGYWGTQYYDDKERAELNPSPLSPIP